MQTHLMIAIFIVIAWDTKQVMLLSLRANEMNVELCAKENGCACFVFKVHPYVNITRPSHRSHSYLTSLYNLRLCYSAQNKRKL